MPRALKLIPALMLALIVAACGGSYELAKDGSQTTVGNMVLRFSGDWSVYEGPSPESGHDALWTVNGVSLDQISIYSGVTSGERLLTLGDDARDSQMPAFRSTMTRDQILSVIAAALQHAYNIDNVEFTSVGAYPFLLQDGFTYHFKGNSQDAVDIQGDGYAAVVGGQLYLLKFVGKDPFYGRLKDSARQIADSARLSGGGS